MHKKPVIKALILFLLLSQFVTLAHAIEHPFVTDNNDQCLICVHASNSKNAIIDTSIAIIPDRATSEKIQFRNQTVYSSSLSSFTIRSPPLPRS